MADPLDEVLADSPAFAAAVRRFRLRVIWSVVSGVSAIAGLVPLAHWVSTKLFHWLPQVPPWVWQWGVIVTAVVTMWWTLSVPSILIRRVSPPRERRYLEVDLDTGIAINELRVAGVRRPKLAPPNGRLIVDVTDRPDALHGYRYDVQRRIFLPPATAASVAALPLADAATIAEGQAE